MPDWNTEKGIAITDATPTGDAGVKLNDNFERLRDETPFNAASNPTVNDDSEDGFFAGSQWFNTSTQVMWVCTDATDGAAVWKSLYQRSGDAIVLAPNTDGAVEMTGDAFAAGRLSGQLTMSPGTQGGGSQFIAGFQNELANWEGRGGSLSTSVEGGASIANAQYVVQPQLSGFYTGNVSFTTTGSATFEFTGLGPFPTMGNREWGPYLLLRAGQQPSQVTVELQNEATDAWVTVWNDTSPVFRLNLWYPGLVYQPFGNEDDPKGFRITLTYTGTDTSYVRSIGFYHRNRALGDYVFPYLNSDNNFVGDNNIDGSVQVDSLKLDGNTLSSTDINGPLIIAPNGSGAVQVDSGGNARGTYAIDLQSQRSSATQVASGAQSFVSGKNNTASGDTSHAEGQGTTAAGARSHAEGQNTTASGNFSHAEGYATTASGSRSHAEGASTVASGNHSHAGGYATTASGHYSHSQGRFVTAGTAIDTHVVGKGQDDSNRLVNNTAGSFLVGFGGTIGALHVIGGGASGRVVQSAIDGAPASGDLWNESAVFYLDETTDQLKVKVKFGDGTVKTAVVADFSP